MMGRRLTVPAGTPASAGTGLPILRGIEHVSMTVPDLDEATEFFADMFGPEYPGQKRLWPGMLDIGGWHLAFYVDDVDAVLARLGDFDLRVLGGKKPAYKYEAGEGAYTVHCLTPFGFYFEFVTYPHGRYRAGEFSGSAWHPADPSR
jgi:catechol 2,3-dioxygenase-like lactoylglutathione lyase family enzyme